jgi:hypothetical protein
MNPIKTITQLIQRLWHHPAQANERPTETVHKLLRMLISTQEVEYSCDEVYHLLDQYAEMVARGEDAGQLMPLINNHLDLCKDCHEEYDALILILEAVPA